MNNLEFVQKLKNVTKHKTLYVMGCFGAAMSDKNKSRYTTNNSYNMKTSRTKMIRAASANTFGFDCVGLIKGILWGWRANQIANYGGAIYASNDVPDISANTMIEMCSNVSTKFTDLEIGEVVWMKGHIGVYIGDGLVIESSPKWANGVQITACNRTIKGYKRRNWTKHGKLPYIEYVAEQKIEEKTIKEVCEVDVATLKKGARGKAVKALQTLLIGYGFSCGKTGADGDFGSSTLNAVKSFQKNRKLTVDGVVGSDTWNHLLGLK